MRNFIFLLFVCFHWNFCSAQKEIDAKKKATLLTRFSFKQYSGGVMIVQAKLNNLPDTLNFILDTGSGGISLDSSTCAAFNLNFLPSDTIVTGIGGTHKVNFIFNQTLHLPGLTVDSLNFHVNDYELLSTVYGEKIDGIIGYSFFSRYITKINFDNSTIEVFSPGVFSYPNGGTMLHPAFTTLPIQNMYVKDARKIGFGFYFDTGAGLYFLMSENFALDSSIFLPKRKFFTTQAEGMGGKLQMKLTTVKSVQIGKYKFKNVPTYLFKDINNVTSYPFVGGLVGNDLLRRFNMILNYPKREIHLLPNEHYYDKFDYSYTGLAIYMVDGNIIVDEVIKGSPANLAGLLIDDIILGVGNNLTNNIMQYKELLQSPGQKIPILISRNGELKKLFIKPVSIL